MWRNHEHDDPNFSKSSHENQQLNNPAKQDKKRASFGFVPSAIVPLSKEIRKM